MRHILIPLFYTAKPLKLEKILYTYEELTDRRLNKRLCSPTAFEDCPIWFCKGFGTETMEFEVNGGVDWFCTRWGELSGWMRSTCMPGNGNTGTTIYCSVIARFTAICGINYITYTSQKINRCLSCYSVTKVNNVVIS